MIIVYVCVSACMSLFVLCAGFIGMEKIAQEATFCGEVSSLWMTARDRGSGGQKADRRQTEGRQVLAKPQLPSLATHRGDGAPLASDRGVGACCRALRGARKRRLACRDTVLPAF
jgi:hypothetical protein